MKKYGLFALLFALLLVAIVPAHSAFASPGFPGSGEFAYGAVLYTQPASLAQSLEMAGNMGINWLSIPLNWSVFQTVEGSVPDWAVLDYALQYADEHKIDVLINLTHAPAWAMTGSGPDPAKTTVLLSLLAARYPAALKAVELFPGANTTTGWGAAPNPAAYAALLSQVANSFRSRGSSILIAAGGFVPVQPGGSVSDQDDITFLKELYALGAGTNMPVVSLQLGALTGSPVVASDNSERRVLRHYEDIRQVMLENNHETGLIWITRLSAPDGAIHPEDGSVQDARRQCAWLQQAFQQIRAQLYIGVVFYDSLNPTAEIPASQNRALLQPDNQYHLLYNIIRELVTQNAPERTISLRGRPKDGGFIKN